MEKEKEFENRVKKWLKEKGCWYLKTWSNGIQRKGIPDLLISVNGFFVAAELKSMDGKPTDLQLKEIEKIRKSNGVAMVLYPDQFEVFKAYMESLMEKENDNYFSGQWIFDEGIK